jgi:glutamyl-tRNA reductase
VVSSTGAEGYVVTKEHVQATMKQRRHRPLFLIDIAVPRDLDPEMAKIDNVFLYDIDDLEGVIAVNLQERQKEAEKVGVIIGEELAAFKQWLNQQEAIPLIQQLREKALQAQSNLMQNLINKMPNLTEKEMHTVNKLTNALVNQLIHEPIKQVKEMATEKDAELYLEAFSRIFGLKDGNSQKKAEQAHQMTNVIAAASRQIEQSRQEEAASGVKRPLLKRLGSR